MELILDIFLEKRRPDIRWRQIACAILLAFLTAGMCSYTGALPGHGEGFGVRELPRLPMTAAGNAVKLAAFPGTAPEAGMAEVEDLPASSGAGIAGVEDLAAILGAGMAKVEDLPIVPGTVPEIGGTPDNAAGPGRTAGDIAPAGAEAAAKDGTNYAVSYGGYGAETETKSRTNNWIKSSAVANNQESNRTNNRTNNRANSRAGVKPARFAGKRANGDIKHAGDVPAAPATGIFTGEKDLPAGDKLTDLINPDKADGPGTKPATVWERFPGFLANEKGHITGYTDAARFMKDHLVVFPVNAECTGIEKDALKGLETEVFEIYIPANISYIANGAFDGLVNLYYIEAAPENSRFYSENGILYYRDGKVAVCPRMIMGEQRSGKK